MDFFSFFFSQQEMEQQTHDILFFGHKFFSPIVETLKCYKYNRLKKINFIVICKTNNTSKWCISFAIFVWWLFFSNDWLTFFWLLRELFAYTAVHSAMSFCFFPARKETAREKLLKEEQKILESVAESKGMIWFALVYVTDCKLLI